MLRNTSRFYLVLLCVLPVITTEAAPRSDKPNLLLIYCDDLGWDDVSYNGHPIVKTPNIDALAADGMIFDHNDAGAPHCSPSRTVLMLGKSSCRVGVYDIMGRSDMKLPKEETTIAEVLHDAGYAIRDGDWKLLAIAEQRPNGRTVVEHIKQGGFSGYELYNLKDDPNEDNDLAASRPKELTRMKKLFLPLHKEIVSDRPMLRMKGDNAPR